MSRHAAETSQATNVVVNLPADPEIRRILIIKWSAMGDIVVSTTLMADIRKAFPHAQIDLALYPPWDSLFRGSDWFSNILAVNPRRGKPGGGVLRWLRQARAGRYDLIVDLQSNDRSGFLVALLRLLGGGGRYRIGLRRRFAYNICPASAPRSVHTIDLQREALQLAGIPTLTPRPVLPLTAEDRQRAGLLQQQEGLTHRKYAVLLPGSQAGGTIKRWGASRYARLAQLLHDDGLEKVVLIGGPDEVEECERILDACHRPGWLVNLRGRTQIKEIVPLCEDALYVVGNDTGTAHIASCTDRPMVVVFGPTNPLRCKPVGDNVVALQADVPCINCYQKGCDHHSCMERITPEQVLRTLKEMASAGD